MKLTIELVPRQNWYFNLRSELSKLEWDSLRKQTYKNSNYMCDICSAVGNKHPVECHEIWEYNDKDRIQTLEGLTSLCPSCHEVKHIGLAIKRGRYNECLNQLMKVNNINKKQAELYIKESFEKFQERSKYKYKLDISKLKTLKENK